jgi:hypothetical protein
MMLICRCYHSRTVENNLGPKKYGQPT